MKIYSLGVKFPYVIVSRIGKQLKDEEIMLMRNVRNLGFFSLGKWILIYQKRKKM